MPDHNERALTGFSAALREHERVVGLEGDMPAETRLWHLLVSALEFCDTRMPRLDFDLIVQDARAHFEQER